MDVLTAGHRGLPQTERDRQFLRKILMVGFLQDGFGNVGGKGSRGIAKGSSPYRIEWISEKPWLQE